MYDVHVWTSLRRSSGYDTMRVVYVLSLLLPMLLQIRAHLALAAAINCQDHVAVAVFPRVEEIFELELFSPWKLYCVQCGMCSCCCGCDGRWCGCVCALYVLVFQRNEDKLSLECHIFGRSVDGFSFGSSIYWKTGTYLRLSALCSCQ